MSLVMRWVGSREVCGCGLFGSPHWCRTICAPVTEAGAAERHADAAALGVDAQGADVAGAAAEAPRGQAVGLGGVPATGADAGDDRHGNSVTGNEGRSEG